MDDGKVTNTVTGAAGAQGGQRKVPKEKVSDSNRYRASNYSRLGLYVSVSFKAPVLVTMCMGVEDRSPIGMLVLVEKRYGGKSLLDMIIRWQKYIVATPKGDIAYWLDENRLTELQIQRDYCGKIPNEFFTAQLLKPFLRLGKGGEMLTNQEISEYHLVKGLISLRKANADLELLNSKTLVGTLLRDLRNECAEEIIALQELAKKTGRETFDTLAKNCGWEFTHDQF
eukprot:g24649.t1